MNAKPTPADSAIEPSTTSPASSMPPAAQCSTQEPIGEQRDEALKGQHHYRYADIWRIAFPILLASLVEQIINLTDTIFLGHVGEVELGASALAGIFFMALFMPLLGFSTGAQILIGRRNGEGRRSEMGSIFYHSLAFLLTLSLVLWGLTKWCAPWLMRELIQSEQVRDATLHYLDYRLWGLGFSAVACLFRAFYIGTTKTSVLKYNSAVMVLVNVVGNYLLIFGHCGLPKMGIGGAALASSLSGLMSMLFFIAHTLRKIDVGSYALNRLPRLRFALLRQMLGLSIWTMLQYSLSIGMWFGFFLAIEHLGKSELAASNVLRSLQMFLIMIANAFASTGSTLTANLLGQGRPQAVFPVLRRCILFSASFLLPLLGWCSLLPELTLGLFTTDAHIISMAIPSLWILALSLLLLIPAQIYFLAISGSGNTRTALAIEVAALLVYAVYIYVCIVDLRLSLAWAWGSEVAYNLVFLACAYGYMRFGAWHQRKL